MTEKKSDPTVLIVGAGTGGLMLALLCEKGNIPYMVFEKSRALRPLGSAIALNKINHLFEQVGIMEEVEACSKSFGGLHLLDQDLYCQGSFYARAPGVSNKETYGYTSPVMARPDLIRILASRIPSDKLHYNKRVIDSQQDSNQVTITCSDKTTYSGTILVGTDGAYSSIRQNMFKELESEGLMHTSDAEPMRSDYECVVGVTGPMDTKDYPLLKEERCEFKIVMGKTLPMTWWFMPLVDPELGPRVGWMITKDSTAWDKMNKGNGSSNDNSTQGSNSDWSANAAKEMCDLVKDMPCPLGGVVGDIVDKTPKEQITKVVLEDKFYHNWYHGRTVLLGDACHKMLPFGGMGASMAIMSAVALANILYEDLPTTQEEVTKAFKEYYDERSGWGQQSVDGSRKTGYLMHTQGFVGNLIRRIGLNWIPTWLIKKGTDAYNEYRPHIVFLPFTTFKGTYQSGRTNTPSKRWLATQNQCAVAL
ncbi:hypothetical protein BGZ96_012700 [Linnemannia gamsii]|uniref:FAD-binding domain-containing protein n=1 Tax=Linnemannia gamsii TaxID=64522 RepID=A0ABQ7KBN9_9FUNG|nr:hypothetical protein BGZ96_012700 [Linnemannia gamsii]